ncbi:hypothetical protein [Cohnella zeiphila]|uniref:Signal peptide protein n=1 Tax=Cohnella zeiphila TaxID=2761120 RepID=A0A7X0SIS6_9BACL|nr:hypothetical protein [Cohnella zeiphila]MBB6730727.1 signal peptide protein [Cohnella zeiphila]
MKSNLSIASRSGRLAKSGVLLTLLLLAALLGSCSTDQPSVFSTTNNSATVAGTERIPWDYRMVEGTVGDLVGSDMTVLPDNALLPNDDNYATGDKIWTLQYMTADMGSNESGNSEIQLSSWTTIKSYKDEAKAKADLSNLKVSLQTSVPLVGVYKTEYQGKTRNFAVLTLPSGNQIKQPIDDERYKKLKDVQKVMIKVEEVHDYSDYDMAYAKFRGWV